MTNKNTKVKQVFHTKFYTETIYKTSFREDEVDDGSSAENAVVRHKRVACKSLVGFLAFRV